jgi:hypothetical protein
MAFYWIKRYIDLDHVENLPIHIFSIVRNKIENAVNHVKSKLPGAVGKAQDSLEKLSPDHVEAAGSIVKNVIAKVQDALDLLEGVLPSKEAIRAEKAFEFILDNDHIIRDILDRNSVVDEQTYGGIRDYIIAHHERIASETGQRDSVAFLVFTVVKHIVEAPQLQASDSEELLVKRLAHSILNTVLLDTLKTNNKISRNSDDVQHLANRTVSYIPEDLLKTLKSPAVTLSFWHTAAAENQDARANTHNEESSESAQTADKSNKVAVARDTAAVDAVVKVDVNDFSLQARKALCNSILRRPQTHYGQNRTLRHWCRRNGWKLAHGIENNKGREELVEINWDEWSVASQKRACKVLLVYIAPPDHPNTAYRAYCRALLDSEADRTYKSPQKWDG